MIKLNYKKSNLFILSILLIVSLVFTCSTYGQDLSSTNFNIQVNVIDSAGSDIGSANYDISYSLGQPSIIGDLVSDNYNVYAGYWNALSGIGTNYFITGSGYNYPEAGYRASLSLDVKALSLGTSWLEYYYSKLRLQLESTLITEVSVVGNTIIIEGNCTVNGLAGYTFKSTIIEGNPDIMSIVIYNSDSTIYFDSTPSTLSSGDYSLDSPVTCVSLPARITGTMPEYYSFLQDAYELIEGGDTLQSRDVLIMESLNFDRNVAIALDGGFNCHYSADTGITRINGNINISSGTVTIGNIILE